MGLLPLGRKAVSLVQLFLLSGLLVCGGGGGGGGSDTPPAPAITSFVAEKSPITQGSGTHLTAVFTNGTGSVDHGVGSVTSGQSVLVSPQANTTYTLTVTGSGGSTSRSVTVEVVPPPVITSFSANPTAISTGGTSSLTAVFSGGSGTVNQGIGPVTSGVPVSTGSLTTSRTYVLTVSNLAGASQVAETTVSIVPVGISAISPASPIRTVGTSTTFTAVVSGSANTSITWSATAGSMIASTGFWTAPPTPQSVTITATANADPTRTSSTQATVVAAPAITSFTATPPAVSSGGSSSLLAVFTGGSGTIDQGLGSVASGAAVSTGPLTASRTYDLTVANAAGLAIHAQATVTVVQGPLAMDRAEVNFQADPEGRVVEVHFNQPVTLTFPSDQFRFDIDLVRPLGRDLAFAVGDLDGDGIPDLMGAGFDGHVRFFRGMPGSPRRFGSGRMVRLAQDWLDSPFLIPMAGEWRRVALADLNGDGSPEIIIGNRIYSMATPHDPTVLVFQLPYLYSFLDPIPATGDFNGDGKADILLTGGRGSQTFLYLNQCTATTFAFQEVELPMHPLFPTVGDLNGDGLPDILAYNGIWYNNGTRTQYAFNYANPLSVTVTGSTWVGADASDQGCTLSLCDGDGDGLLDLYMSSFGNSVWQGTYYRNTGTAQAPVFTYQAPLVCTATPYDNFYRGSATPNISGTRAYVSVADVNRDGLPDLLVSDGAGSFSKSTVLWNRSDLSGRHFAWMDIYTFTTAGYPAMDPYSFPNVNWLVDLPLRLADQTGDGLEDLVRSHAWMDAFSLYLMPRTELYPFSFNRGMDDSHPGIPLLTQGGQPIVGLGLAVVDVDRDGRSDWVLGGTSANQLNYYRNVGTNSAPVFAEVTSLPGTSGLGENLWPAAVDVDGDSEAELVVGTQGGSVYILKNQGGSYSALGLVGAAGWDPVNLSGGIIGGGVLSASPAGMDVDGDGKVDFLAGSYTPSAIWYFRNLGQIGSLAWDPQFVSIDRTIPGSVTKVDDQTYRLYFGFPAVPGETKVSFYPQWDSKENLSLTIQNPTP